MNIAVKDFGKREPVPVSERPSLDVFEPGDKVRCCYTFGRPGLTIGAEYTIQHRTPLGYYKLVELGDGHAFHGPHFELVEHYQRRVPRRSDTQSRPDGKTAIKHDDGKVPYHLIDPLFLESTAKVLGFGAQKYAAWNWALGTFKWSRLFSACLRHLWAFWRGKELDDETGMPHLWHAACCLMFLIRYHHSKLGTDDRHIFKASVTD